METCHWDVLATFHGDVVVYFIWDVTATSLGRTERRRYDVATTSCCRVGTLPILTLNLWWKIIDGCTHNPEKSSTTRMKHIPCRYFMSTIWVFDYIENKNKHSFYRRKDCTKKFTNSFRKHAKSTIDFEKEKVSPLTKKELKSHQNATVY